MKPLLFLLRGAFLLLAAPLAAADYTSPTLYTRQVAPAELEVDQVQILQETDLGDGRVLLEVTGNLVNAGEALWDTVSANVIEQFTATFEALQTQIAWTAGIAVGEVVQLPERITVIVSAAEQAPALAEFAAGETLDLIAETASGVVLENTPDVVFEVVNTAIVTLDNGDVLLEFAVNVTNNLAEAIVDLGVFLATGETSIGYQAPARVLEFNTQLPAYGNQAPERSMTAIVPAAEVNAVRSALVDADSYEIVGRELWVFNAPPHALDGETEGSFEAGSITDLTFTASTVMLEGLSVGDLLVADPSVHSVTALDSNAPGPDVIAQYLPFLITDIQAYGTGGVRLVGEKKDLLEVVRSATFIQDATMVYDRPVRDPYDPELENNYTRDERAERDAAADLIEVENPNDGRLADLRGMNAIPWRFNELEINPRVRATGELLIRSSGIKLDLKIRNFQVQHAIAYVDAGVEMNLVFEVGPAEEEEAPPPLEGWRRSVIDPVQLIDFVPPIVFNVAGVPVTLQPTFRFDLGADANFPTALALPLQSAFTIGAEMGWDRALEESTGDGYFYTPFREVVPLRVSDPTFFQEISATATVWAEFAAGLEGTIALGVAAHPEVTVRFENDFTVAPFSTPLWEVEATGSLAGQFGFRLLGVELVDVGATFAEFPLYSFSGPSAAASPGLEQRMARPDSSADRYLRRIAPAGGAEARWAMAYRADDGAGPVDRAVFLPEVGDEVIWGFVTQSNRSAILQLDATGQLLSEHRYLRGPSFLGAEWLDDGRVLAGGAVSTTDFWVGPLDLATDLDTLATPRVFRTPQQVWAEFAIGRPGCLDGPCFFIVGHTAVGSILESDPAVMAFDAAGDPVWSSFYASPGDDAVFDLLVTSDSGLVLSGSTSADVLAPPRGSPVTENTFVNATGNGLLMKLDADGELLWSTAIASRYPLTLMSAVEAPDGHLYVLGQVFKTVVIDYPAIWIGKFTADGVLLDHVTIGEHPEWDDVLDTGGNTPWDLGYDLIWTPEGLWACGSTGVGDDTSAWLMSLTEELGVRFFAVVDGPLGEEFLSLQEMDTGVLAAGASRSILPVGGGGTWAALIAHVPWEGILRLRPETGLRTVLLQPQVFHSSADEDFAVYSEVQSLPPARFSNQQSPIAMTRTDLPLEERATFAFGLPPGTDEPLALAVERVERVVSTYDDWADFHLLAAAARDTSGAYPPDAQRHPDNDLDGDGLSLAFEAFLGLDPWVAETDLYPFEIAFSGTDPGLLEVSFKRLAFDENLPVQFQSSADLAAGPWAPISADRVTVQPLPDGFERVTLSLPADALDEFFRFDIEFGMDGHDW